jgi:hypothetical protein
VAAVSGTAASYILWVRARPRPARGERGLERDLDG